MSAMNLRQLARNTLRRARTAPSSVRALAWRIGGRLPTTPLSRTFGFERGTPVDRVYIERFLEQHRALVRGRGLEVADTRYLQRFGPDGGNEGVRASVLHLLPGANVDVVGDLCEPRTLPHAAFDVFICTQTLQFVRDPARAMRGIATLLDDGGAALITVPGITPRSRYDADRWGDRWRFTPQALTTLIEGEPALRAIDVRGYGNYAVAVAALAGACAEDLPAAQLSDDANDDDFPVIVAAAVVKQRVVQ